MRFIISFTALLLVAMPVQAGQKYSTWSNPEGTAESTGDVTTRQLLDKLNALIDEAEQARAADPVFLEDLRNLVRSFDAPRLVPVFQDDFTDGDFTANPVWMVSAGRYWIEKGWGLRSAVSTEAKNTPEPESTTSGDRDIALAILGAVLKQATKNKNSDTANQEAAKEPEFAAIHSAATITNAFSISLNLSSWQPKGDLEVGVYQGADRTAGYWLSYTPGGAFSLIRRSARGTTVIRQPTTQIALEDEKTHNIVWSRDTRGRMKITIDGKNIVDVSDRGFNAPFQGVAITNKGGDYIMRKIAVSAYRKN